MGLGSHANLYDHLDLHQNDHATFPDDTLHLDHLCHDESAVHYLDPSGNDHRCADVTVIAVDEEPGELRRAEQR